MLKINCCLAYTWYIFNSWSRNITVWAMQGTYRTSRQPIFINLPCGNISHHATPNRKHISQLPPGHLYHGHLLCPWNNINVHHHWISTQIQPWYDVFIYTPSISDCPCSYITPHSRILYDPSDLSPILVLGRMGPAVMYGGTDLWASIPCRISLLCQRLCGIRQFGALISDLHIAQG